MDEIKQWEYQIINAGSFWSAPKQDALEEMLNEMGIEGWEVADSYLVSNSNKLVILLKRPLTRTALRRRTMPGRKQ